MPEKQSQAIVQVAILAEPGSGGRAPRNRYDGDFTVEAANRALADYQRFYHQVRPHQALDFTTPDEYLRKNKDSPAQSHMC